MSQENNQLDIYIPEELRPYVDKYYTPTLGWVDDLPNDVKSVQAVLCTCGCLIKYSTHWYCNQHERF